MVFDERDEKIDLRLIYPSIKLPYYLPKMGIHDILSDTIKLKEMDADKHHRY